MQAYPCVVSELGDSSQITLIIPLKFGNPSTELVINIIDRLPSGDWPMFESNKKLIKINPDKKTVIRNTPSIYWYGNQIKKTNYPDHGAAGKIPSRYCDPGTTNSLWNSKTGVESAYNWKIK